MGVVKRTTSLAPSGDPPPCMQPGTPAPMVSHSDRRAALKRDDAYIFTGGGHGLRSSKWAYMWYPAGKKDREGFMLYDMGKDPHQFTNLAGLPEHADTRRTLHQRLLERIEHAKN